MDDSVEAVDGELVLKLKRFLLEEGGNEIIVSGPQKFIYSLSDTVSKGHGSNRSISVIGLGTGELTETPETGNDILIDIYGKIRIQYVVYDPEPDVRHGE